MPQTRRQYGRTTRNYRSPNRISRQSSTLPIPLLRIERHRRVIPVYPSSRQRTFAAMCLEVLRPPAPRSLQCFTHWVQHVTLRYNIKSVGYRRSGRASSHAKRERAGTRYNKHHQNIDPEKSLPKPVDSTVRSNDQEISVSPSHL